VHFGFGGKGKRFNLKKSKENRYEMIKDENRCEYWVLSSMRAPFPKQQYIEPG
jgi:hypothetical protein